MRKEVLLTLVIGAVMFTACDKDSLNMDTSRNEKVYAILPLTEQTTKTTINQNLQVVWSVDDAISVFTESGNSSFKGTISGGSGTTEATFNVTIEGNNKKVAAVYPYISTTTFDGTTASITMPETYTYVENGIGGAPMAALISDQDANIAFQNAGALMGITVNNIPAGYNTATLTSLGAQALTGTCEITFDDGVPTLVTTGDVIDDRKEITITFEAAKTATNKTFFFPIPVQAYESLSISISNGTDTKIMKTSGLNAKRSVRYKSTLTPDQVSIPVASADELKTAIGAAEAGATINLLADIEMSEILVINKAITLDGNGKKLTSTAGRAINVSGADGVTIQDLTIECSGERGINIIQNATNVTIDNVTATAANYTVCVAGSAPDAVVTITGSTLTGKNVVNVGAVGADVTVSNSTLNCNDDDTSASGNFAALCLNKDATGGTITATGTTITVTDGSDSVPARNDAEGGTITINGSAEGVVISVAVIENGNYYADYTTLQAAIDAAPAGQTVKLIRDITASEIITINKAITLDGNGKTLTSSAERAINVSGADGVTIKNLTIDCNGERAINIIQNATNVEINNVTATADNYTVNVAGSAPNAVVTITESTLTGKNVVNVAAVGANVTVSNSTLNCEDDDTSASGNFAALCLNKDATGARITATEGITINVADNSDSVPARNDAEGGTITIDGSSDNVVQTVAVITHGDYYADYTTLQAAINAAESGQTVKLIRDITASEIITINKAITLDGNGKTLTSTAGRAINVSGANGVTIANLTINCTGERGINIIQSATNVTIDNVTIDADNYAVNIAGSAQNAVVTIQNSDFTGKNVVNVGGVSARVTVTNTKLTNDNTEENDDNQYAILCLNKDATGGSSIAATNCTFTLGLNTVKGRNDTADGTVTIDGTTTDVVKTVAYINYGTYYKPRATFKEIVEVAKAGDKITLIRDITASEVILIDKNITIDGNNKTITSSANRVFRLSTTGINVTMTDLNIVSTAVCGGTDNTDIRGISFDGIAGMTLTLTNCSVDFTDDSANAYAWGVNMSGSNPGVNTLTINGGTYEGANAININGNGHTISIDGATLTSLYEYKTGDTYTGACVAIAGENNKLTVKNSTFNGSHAVGIKERKVDEVDYAGKNEITKDNNNDNTSTQTQPAS